MVLVLELLFYSLAGILFGTVLGLLPGMHINNILPIILSLFVFLQPTNLALFIVSIAVSQIFTSYITSIFLGAPDEETALSVLPGHRMLLEGRGMEAIKLTVIGGIGGLLVSLLFIAILSTFFSQLYDLSRPYIHFVIGFVVIVMIILEKNWKKCLSAAIIFMLSGTFGFLVLDSTILPKQNALFPVLSGLFGLSTLAISSIQNSKLPEQDQDGKVNMKKSEILKSLILGSFAGIIVGFLPAIGVSQAATLVQYLGATGEARNFLVTISGINIANEVFSLISLFLVGNPRSGASVAIGNILGELTLNDVLLLIGVICFTAGISAIITMVLSKKIPKILVKINYRTLTSLVIVFVTSMVIMMTGLVGLLVLFTAISIGMLCNYLGIKRSHCMGVLLLPTILFFSNMSPSAISFLGI